MKFRQKVSASALALGVVSCVTALSMSACQTKDASRLREDAAMSGMPATDPATLAANAKTALNQYCGSCHGPQAPEALGAIGYIDDLQKLVDKKKVKRGTAEEQKKSRVLVRMYDTESPMPPLATEEGTPIDRMPEEAIKAIEAWILADAPVPAAGGAVPTPTPEPAQTPIAAPGSPTGGDPAALATAARGALDRACGSCHGPQAPEALGAIGYINDLQKLVDKKKVKRGTADEQKKSRVLVRMKDAESPMPPAQDDAGNAVAPMTPDDAAAIEAWIMADSPVPAP